MVEFAFVLPIFLLLVMGILDFGFLFYNYISMENAARNAARVACVDYEDVAYDSQEGGQGKIIKRDLPLPSENATDKAAYSSATEGGVPYSDGEKEICVQVARSIQRTGIDKEGVIVTVEYTYDTSEPIVNEPTTWKIANRYNGDVKVTVQGDAHVLTPVLGVSANHMKKKLVSTSTFKVEKQPEETS